MSQSTLTESDITPQVKNASARVPISVLIPAKNEQDNLKRCLEPLNGWADEIVIVDSHSTDDTRRLTATTDATVVQFDYQGGWPKKRQWAMDNLEWKNEWILLLDADEILTDAVKQEIEEAIRNPSIAGYWLPFRIVFLGRMLRFGDTQLWKCSLFRREHGRYEKRLEQQDASMSDIEVHEHVVVDGQTARLKSPVRHENWNSLDRYIQKHNEYSNWEAEVWLRGTHDELPPSLFGNQAQRRRWLKRVLFRLPGAPLIRFLYVYVIRLGFLDGRPGLIYAMFKFVQTFHVRAKVYESNSN
ncbi:glycosyltransferase family 2 protein [Symmachiella dynata]|uniref:glycosyltransferase family 2 protein n=1 Tax=Symmachiella dynata TaxID=2527995 RepID=UPI0030EE8628|tara:strand:- start:723 stop:1622 length:900 start_codon:yes stop_codon:yes gene_type:complete